jgi:transmembrane sensor
MGSPDARLSNALPRQIRAQAAAWVAELHSPDRNLQMEASLRRWIAKDPRHAAAFELATEAWQLSGDLPADLPSIDRLKMGRPAFRGWQMGLTASAIFCGLLVAAAFYLRDPTFTTGPDEQRVVSLADGSQLTLNARSAVRLQFGNALRQLTLLRGEAYFQVAKDPSRPFVVLTGSRKVVALGTSFVVRRERPDGSAFAVTLIEGQVAVEPAADPNTRVSADQSKDKPSTAPTAPAEKFLKPGDRLRFNENDAGTVDNPSIDKVTAWQRGLLIFEDATLREAAGEFNRYGTLHIDVDGAASELRVGGVFMIGDAASFAQSMARAHGLRMSQQGQTIHLAR